MKLKCKNYGLLTNTEVEDCEGRILVTNGLGIEDLVKLWRWYYNVPFFETIELEVSERLFNASKQRALKGVKSVQELLYDQKVIVLKELQE